MPKQEQERKRVIITGANGMVGIELTRQILADPQVDVIGTFYHRPPPLDLLALISTGRLRLRRVDLTSTAHTAQLFGQEKPSLIYHLAGEATDNPLKGDLVYQENVAICQNILDALPVQKPDRRLVFASTVVRNGRPTSDREIEEVPCSKLPVPDRAKYPYWASKYAQEVMLADRQRNDPDFNYVTAILSQTTGPHRRGEVVDLRLVDETLAVLRGEKSHREVFNKAAFINLLSVEDTVRGLITVGSLGKSGDFYTIASEQVQIAELAKILNEIVKQEIETVSTKEELPVYARYSSDKLRQLGWRPQISIQQTMERLYRWRTNQT